MSIRKKIFFTSDWHLFHEPMIKYSKRPFKDVSHMHNVLINNYNNSVPEDGICYFLGDMVYSKERDKSIDIINRLNGTKVLILGNHDKGVNSMYSSGFDIVISSASLTIAKEVVTLSHYPLLGIFKEDVKGMRNAVLTDNWHGESRRRNIAIEDRGQFHLHGHLHSRCDRGKVKDGRQWDVGVDGNNFTPVSISRVESWISQTKEVKK